MLRPWAMVPLLLASTSWACGSRAQPEASDTGDPPAPAARPALVREPKPRPQPRFAELPEPVRAKLELHHAKLELPPDYRIEVNDPKTRRVDFIARPPGDAFALLYDFGAEPTDSSELAPIVEQAVWSFAHNYARDDRVSKPRALGSEIAGRFGADEIVRTCFSPAEYLGETFCCGVAFGLFRRDAGIVMLLVLTDDHTGCIDEIGEIGPEMLGFSFGE